MSAQRRRRPSGALRPAARSEPAAAYARTAARTRPGRPPLSGDAVRSRVAEYCARYGVTSSLNGLPPFPSGQRETPQHHEWLTVYRAVRRLAARLGTRPEDDAAVPDTAPRSRDACPVCDKPLPAFGARELKLLTRPPSRARLHEACADLAERARAAGPGALDRLSSLLWPARRSR